MPLNDPQPLNRIYFVLIIKQMFEYSKKNETPGRPVSRILSRNAPRRAPWMVIHLGRRSPCASSSLPGMILAVEAGAGSAWTVGSSDRASSLLGLAPGGGCLAASIAARAGGLLRKQPAAVSGQANASGIRSTTFSPLPGRWKHLPWRYVSVARSVRLPRPGSSPAPRPVECRLSSETAALGGKLQRPSSRPGVGVVYHGNAPGGKTR
jgi:hypothetical protein